AGGNDLAVRENRRRPGNAILPERNQRCAVGAESTVELPIGKILRHAHARREGGVQIGLADRDNSSEGTKLEAVKVGSRRGMAAEGARRNESARTECGVGRSICIVTR